MTRLPAGGDPAGRRPEALGRRVVPRALEAVGGRALEQLAGGEGLVDLADVRTSYWLTRRITWS